MIAGSMVALVTPMDAQGRIDWDNLTKLVDFHLAEWHRRHRRGGTSV